MLIIEITALENGAHRNQHIDTEFIPPYGWAVVAPDIVDKATSMLPFINIDKTKVSVSDDGETEYVTITAVSQGTIPDLEPDDTPPDPITQLQNIVDMLVVSILEG